MFGCVHQNNIRTGAKTDFVAHLRNSTVALVAEKDGDWRTYCTGVWIDEKTVITAYHCTADDLDADEMETLDTEIMIGLYNDFRDDEITKAYKSKVVYVSKDTDLAILKAYSDIPINHDFVNISAGPLPDGSNVHIVGHPLGFLYTYMKGQVSNTRIMENSFGVEDSKILQIAAPVYYGNSGGGAFDDDGNLIGIASFISRMPCMGFFVHYEVIQEQVNKYRLKK